MAAKKPIKPSPAKSKPAAKTPAPKAGLKADPKPKGGKGEKSGKGEAADRGFLAVGAAAPDFQWDHDGKATKLSSLRGRKVVVYFYPKDQTPGCTQQACDFRDNFVRIQSKGAYVVGVSADSKDSHNRFREKQNLNFPLASDPEKKVLQAYGVWQEKSLYGRKFLGIVRTTYIIDEKGRVSHVFPKVKVAGHVEAVLAAL